MAYDPNYFISKLRLYMPNYWRTKIQYGLSESQIIFRSIPKSDEVWLHFCAVDYFGNLFCVSPEFFEYYTSYPNNPLQPLLDQLNGNLIYKGKKWSLVEDISLYRDLGKAIYHGPIRQGGGNMHLEAPFTCENGVWTIGEFQRV